jgi:hypothetical protein
MTQYLISVWGTEAETYENPDPKTMETAYAQVDAFNKRMQESGAWVFAGGLEAPSTATTVDATNGEAVVTDGPFLETKEQLGGFWVLEAPDLDAALALARDASAACMAKVEVRPFQAE